MNKKQWIYFILLVSASIILVWQIFDTYLLNYYYGSYKYQSYTPAQADQLSKEELYNRVGSRSWKLLFVKTADGIFRTNKGMEAELMLNEDNVLTFEYSCNYTFIDSNSVGNANHMAISTDGSITLNKENLITYLVQCNDNAAAKFAKDFVSPNIGTTASTYYLDDKILLHFTDTNTMLVFR